MGEELEQILRLRTPSAGIKFFEKVGDISPEFEVVKDDVMVCLDFSRKLPIQGINIHLDLTLGQYQNLY